MIVWAVLGCACTGGADGGAFPGGSGAAATIDGKVAALATARARPGLPAARTITHVMAVDPETASPRRSLAAVGTDGTFSLAVETERPYVIVFIDSSAVGADMVVAVFRAGTLDTVSPQLAGHLSLGDVTVDPLTLTATAGVDYDALIAALGLTPEGAAYLGAIDDLSLRYANPDIDGDGVIDLTQDHRYALDVHVRASMFTGDRAVAVADITDQFLPADGAGAARPVFDLTSIYAVYPAAVDATEYVAQAVPGGGLQGGAAFTAVTATGAEPGPSSFSSLAFGDVRGWGPDYSFTQDPALELPGAAAPATLAFTLGASGTVLTFSNVVTTPHATWSQDGTLGIFINLVTGANGTYTRLDYEWRALSGGAWAPATAEAIALAISGQGGYVSLHHMPSWHTEVGIPIPAEPAGSIPWTFLETRPSDVCGLAVSYDDKLGMRHFIGGAIADPGVTCTP